MMPLQVSHAAIVCNMVMIIINIVLSTNVTSLNKNKSHLESLYLPVRLNIVKGYI